MSVDVVSPAHECSYPSREFPCKYALALLFLWVQDRIPESGRVAEPISQWVDARETRAARETELR